MGRIINEKNVKIIVDGLELLKKHLEIFSPIYHNEVVPLSQKYNISDIEKIIQDIKQNKYE